MSDGPNYEQVFRKMQVFHGGNPEDVKHIVRFLRFFKGQDGYEIYAKHYLPMLAPEVAAEFLTKETKPLKEGEKSQIQEEKNADTPITEIVVTEAPKKKAGRPKKSI